MSLLLFFNNNPDMFKKKLVKLGFVPRTYHMQSERSTTELHPLLPSTHLVIYYYHCHTPYEGITHISQCWLHVPWLFLNSTPDLY